MNSKLKHVAATRIWAFVHAKDELDFEEHSHLRNCKHCDAIFKYFAVWQPAAQMNEVGVTEERRQAA